MLLLKLVFVMSVLMVLVELFHHIVGFAHHDLIRWALRGVWALIVAGFGWRAYVGLIKERDWWIEDDNRRRRY